MVCFFFKQVKTSRRTHNETGGGNGDAIQSGPTPGWATHQKCHNHRRPLPKARGPSPHFGLPSPKAAHLLLQENEPPEHLALKNSRAYVWEEVESCRKQTLLFRGRTGTSLVVQWPPTQGSGSIPGQRPRPHMPQLEFARHSERSHRLH